MTIADKTVLVSLMALAALPLTPAYSIPKASAASVARALGQGDETR